MNSVSRRSFLKGFGGVAGSSWMAAHMPLLLSLGQAACSAKDAGAPFETLSAQEAKELSAIAAQIIPATDTPGAEEAGVIYFIDAALGDFMAGAAGFLRGGLQDLLAANGGKFASLSSDEQISALRKIEQEQFFSTMRFLTVVGMFCMPSRGGNRDHAGWNLIDFDHRHAWQAPFGYYDEREGNANE